MMQRRDVLKMLSLSVLAVAGGGALAACGGGSDEGADPDPGAGTRGVALVAADVPRTGGDPAAVPEVVRGLHVSGGALFGSVAGEMSGNLALSPYSVLVAMGLTLNGAAGETQRQLLGLFGGADAATVNGGLNALTADVEALAGTRDRGDGSTVEVVLDAANALFGQEGVAWEQPFLDTLAAEYGAGIRTVDYVGDTEAARTAINSWTARQTRDKITQIIPEGVLDGLTRLVLVNTLYLKAPWETPFEPGITAPQTFTRLDGSTVQAQMMQSPGTIAAPVATGDGWSAVQLAYAGRGLAMTLVLPDQGRYDDIEAAVVGGGLPDYLEALAPGPVNVRLPSWTFRTQSPLRPALEALGVVLPFDASAADFSALTAEERLFVAAVLHEVFIAVDEDGTEAAAATAVVAGATSVPTDELRFVADRPYLFVIHDVAHGAPLFLGRVVDPTA